MKIFTSIRLKRRVLLIFLTVIIFICLTSFYFLNKKRSKILMIGLDGASWNVMMPLIEEGSLPNIKRLMDNGCWGTMRTFTAPISEAVWTTMATGKSPDKHGITDRLIEDPDTGESVIPTSNFRKVKAIWNILSEHNKKIGVVNYLVSWPPEKVNGVIISNEAVNMEGIKYLSKNLSYPPFTTLCSKIRFDGFKELSNSLFSHIERSRFSDFWWEIQALDNFMVNFSKYLLRNKDFDFFCLYIRGIDIVSHRFWKFMLPDGFDVSKEDIQRYKGIISDYYVWCDKVIGDIIKEVNKNTTVIIVSDHGFKGRPNPEYLFLKVNYLLEISGLSKIKKGSYTATAILRNEPVDPYSYIKDIRIIGNLSEEKLSEVRKEAKYVLENIKVKETGAHIFKCKDTKSGFLIQASKVYMKNNPGHHILVREKEYKILDFLIRCTNSGDHSDAAVIIISGANARHNKTIEAATIYDITPTILYLMELPIAKDMFGKVLVPVIDTSFLKKHPIRHIGTYEAKKKVSEQKPMRSPLDEEKIKERMRSLGYIN